MNKIWVTLIMFCLIYGIIRGNVDQMVDAALNVPFRTFQLVIKIGGLIIFYNGLFHIAIDSGLIKGLSKIFKKLIIKLFPELPKDSVAHEYICANLAANFLGLGIAATPMAIKALQEMKKINDNKDTASSSMVVLMLLNITSFCIFPVTIIGIREIYHAKINIELIPYIILITFTLTITSLLIYKLVGRKE